MSSVNKVILVGRLGSDPEVREVSRDNIVANFSVATDESYKKDGEKVKKTEWHRIVVWGKLAEIVEKYLGKGDLVYLEGKLQTRSYEDTKSSTTKYVTEVVVSNMVMLQTQGGERAEIPAPTRSAPSDSRSGRERQVQQRSTQRSRPAPVQQESADEDIPF